MSTPTASDAAVTAVRWTGLAALVAISVMVGLWDALRLVLVANSSGWTSGWGRWLMAVVYVAPLVVLVWVTGYLRRRGSGWGRSLGVGAIAGLVVGLLVLPMTFWL